MSGKQPPFTINRNDHAIFPLRPELWERVAIELHLPPQQTKIVEMLLRRMKCKEIAASLGLGEPTLRTYLRRIYDRLHVADQTELLIHIMAISHSLDGNKDGHRHG